SSVALPRSTTFVPEGACTFAGEPTSLILMSSIRTAAGESTLPVRGSTKRPALISVTDAGELVARKATAANTTAPFNRNLEGSIPSGRLLRSRREGRCDRGDKAVPPVGFLAEAFTAASGQLIKFRPSIVF